LQVDYCSVGVLLYKQRIVPVHALLIFNSKIAFVEILGAGIAIGYTTVGGVLNIAGKKGEIIFPVGVTGYGFIA